MKYLKRFLTLDSSYNTKAKTPLVTIIAGILNKTLFVPHSYASQVKIVSDNDGFITVAKAGSVQIQVLCGSDYYNVGLSGTSYADGDTPVLILSAVTEGGKINDAAFEWNVQAYTDRYAANSEDEIVETAYTIQNVSTGMYLTKDSDENLKFTAFDGDPVFSDSCLIYWYIDTAGNDSSEHNWGGCNYLPWRSNNGALEGAYPNNTYQMRYYDGTMVLSSWYGTGRVKNTTFIS